MSLTTAHHSVGVGCPTCKVHGGFVCVHWLSDMMAERMVGDTMEVEHSAE